VSQDQAQAGPACVQFGSVEQQWVSRLDCIALFLSLAKGWLPLALLQACQQPPL